MATIASWNDRWFPSEHWAEKGPWVHSSLSKGPDGAISTIVAGELVRLSADSHVLSRVPTQLIEGHGLFSASLQGEQVTWVADPGFRMNDAGTHLNAGGVDRSLDRRPRVVALRANGEVALELPGPYELPFAPTSVVADHDSNYVWFADGYGRSRVFRMSVRTGALLEFEQPRDGTALDCPHALCPLLDEAGELYGLLLADRANGVLRTYDLDGRHVSDLRTAALLRPSGLAVLGQLVFVAELDGRITILDLNGDVHLRLGLGDAAERIGWPNLNSEASTIGPYPARSEELVSPHAILALSNDRILVQEWAIGGRCLDVAITW